MTGTAVGARRLGLLPYEIYAVLLGVAAVGTAALLLTAGEPLPPLGLLAVLGGLSALSVRCNVDDNDAPVGMAFSAQGVVIAASVVAFRDTSPLLGPLLIGMCAAFWRIPRTRHQFVTVPGNLGVNGLPALAAAAVLGVLAPADMASTLVLAAVVVPAAVVYAAVNGSLLALYVRVMEGTKLKDIAVESRGQLAGLYLPFAWGAFAGEVALRFGLIIFAVAASVLVIIQAVFAGIRRRVDSKRELRDGLLAALDRKDAYTAAHSVRVARLCGYVGEALGYKRSDLARLDDHATWHDIGKATIANQILRKPGRLDDDERDIMVGHGPAGRAILAQIPELQLSADIAAGLGERDGLDGPVRDVFIVHVCDAFDAITSTRPYGTAKSQEIAITELRRCAQPQDPTDPDSRPQQFHSRCVEALVAELARRGEVWGPGGTMNFEEILFDTPPPPRVLGRVLTDGHPQPAPADGDTTTAAEPAPEPTPAKPRTVWPAELVAPSCLAAAGTAIGVVATVATGSVAAAVAVPVALAMWIGACELVCLAPLKRAPRPLGLVVMLIAAAVLPPAEAAWTIAAGVALAIRLRERDNTPGPATRTLACRLSVGAATLATYTTLARYGTGTDTVTAMLVTGFGACLAGLFIQECFENNTRRWNRKERLADIAVLTCGTLAAIGIAGIGGHATNSNGIGSNGGLGLGALALFMLPLGLLAHGFAQTHTAEQNLTSWIRAARLIPELAGLVVTGRGERVVEYATGIAKHVGYDDDMADQLEAAAWMERLGETCLDATSVTGRPHTPAEIIRETTAILRCRRVARGSERRPRARHLPGVAEVDEVDTVVDRFGDREVVSDTVQGRVGHVLAGHGPPPVARELADMVAE